MDNGVLYQTLSEFLREPFGSPDPENQTRLLKKYREHVGKIKAEACIQYENTYMIHVKIPSESKEGSFYDVVIQFLPSTKEVEKDKTLDRYFVQFFSNSPSFVYKYAVLYKNKGYMIDALQEKMDPNYKDALPTKTNAGMKLSYDKSLFFAGMFLIEKRKWYMEKLVLNRMPKMNFNKFLDGITNYKGEKFDYNIYELESNFKSEILRDIQNAAKHMKLKPKDRSGSPGILPKKKPLSKITPKISTVKSLSTGGMTLSPSRKPKKTGSSSRKPKVRSTRKK